jgi:hypothetical protein
MISMKSYEGKEDGQASQFNDILIVQEMEDLGSDCMYNNLQL